MMMIEDFAFAVLSRQNPALPPRASSLDRAISKIAAATTAWRIWRDMLQSEVARDLIDVSSEMLKRTHNINAPCAQLVIGSRNKIRHDEGGHWKYVVDALILAVESNESSLIAKRWAKAYPLTVMAVKDLADATGNESLSYALNACINAIVKEWQICDAE